MQASKTQQILSAIWMAFLLVIGGYFSITLTTTNRFESNVLNLLPTSLADELRSAPEQNNDIQRKFLLLLDLKGNNASVLDDLIRRLDASSQIVVNQTQAKTLEAIQAFYYPYRQQLLSQKKRQELKALTANQLAQKAYFSLLNPFGPQRINSLAEDPFNLAGDWFSSIRPSNPKLRATQPPSVVDGEATWFIVTGDLQKDGFDPAIQAELLAVIDGFQAQHPTVKILRSGFVFHAAEATAVSKREISTVGIGSILAVLLLVIGVFASYQAILAIAFTLTSSVIVAISVCLLVFDQVNLITLAFGSTLLGLAVDYCFHFIIKYRELGSSAIASQAIRKGLILSALSSIAAYSFQLFTPMSGLQQFAVFMCAGLATSAINILLLGLFFNDKSSRKNRNPKIYSARIAPLYKHLSQYPKSVSTLLLLATLGLVTPVFNKGSNDSLSNLNSSSVELLAAEAKMVSLLEPPDTQRFLKITADNQQALLNRSAEVAQLLKEDPVFNASKPTTSLGILAPSQQQQRQDHALIQNAIYGDNGALVALCQLLNDDCSEFQTQQQAFIVGLTPQRLPVELQAMFPNIALSSPTESMVLFARPPSTSALEQITQFDDIEYIDRVQLISKAMTTYRHNTQMALAGFLTLFSLLALSLYKRRATALLITLAIVVSASLSGASGALSLFHWLALLLVIGLTVDMAIFYLELGLNNSTWLASSMSAITSIIAFGLLSFSQIPVLQHFGSVVFWGLLASWLLTPLIFMMYQSHPTTSKGQVHD